MAPPGNRRGQTGYWVRTELWEVAEFKRNRLQRSLEICLSENALVKSFLPRCDETIKLIIGFPKS